MRVKHHPLEGTNPSLESDTLLNSFPSTVMLITYSGLKKGSMKQIDTYEVTQLLGLSIRLIFSIHLHPEDQHITQDICNILEKAEQEYWNHNRAGGDTSLLQYMQQLLANLPMPRSIYEIQKAHYQLSKIQEYALNELLAIGTYIPHELPLHNNGSAKKSLEVIADVCHKWIVKIENTRKEFETILLDEIPFIYADEE